MTKLLSIIIPTYNMEAFLDKCLSSLILENKEDRESLDVIIVNDGSKDKSLEIAQSYERQYPEMFSVIDKVNGNYGSCINAALPRVKGKYVRILDADDSYNTNDMPAYLEILERENVDIVLTDYLNVNEKGDILSQSHIDAPARRIIQFSDIHVSEFIEMHCVTYRSSIFKDIHYHQTEGVSYTDLEWVFHPMCKVCSAYYYDKVIYIYLNGREGQTVDVNVILKRLSHMEKGLWSMLTVYSTISNDNPSYDYLTSVIKYRAKLLYIWGMDKKAIFDLKTYDLKLKEDYPYIYQMATAFTLPIGIGDLQMPIVKMWRMVRSKYGLYLFPKYIIYCLKNRYIDKKNKLKLFLIKHNLLHIYKVP